MESIAVLGAGIAGMSAAHELAKAGYDVHVYEYANACGGQARSARNSDGFPTEYSWRGYGQFYKNVYELMQEIPINGQTVYDTELSKPIQFILIKDQTNNPLFNAENWTNQFTLKEWTTLALQFSREITSDNRVNEYAAINAKEWMKPQISKDNLDYITSVFGPWIGITSDRLSLHHCMNFFRMIQFPDLIKPYVHKTDGQVWVQDSGSQWSVLRRPSNESWFDPWMNYLIQSYNVKFHFGSKVVRLNGGNNKITSIDILNNDQLINIKHDYYVLATTPFAVADIVSNSSTIIKNDPQLKLFKGLTQDGPHIQVSFFIGFKDYIKIPKSHMAFILTDSEFNLTFYFQNNIWHSDVYLGPNVVSLISGTACVAFTPGKLYGKTLKEVTRDEFEQEILYQMYKCDSLNQIIKNENNGKDLHDFEIIKFATWDGWSFAGEESFTISQKSNEKKWVNSTNTNLYMPSITTSFNNLFIAGAHVKASVDLYSMEAACATGRQAAFNIINKNIKALAVNKPIWARGLSVVDNGLYKVNFPNVVDVIFIVMVIMIIIWIVKKLKK